MRSTDVQSCPALANAPAAACSAAHIGVDAGVDDERVLAAELEQRLAQRRRRADLRQLAAGGDRAGVHDEVHPRMGGQRPARPRVARARAAGTSPRSSSSTSRTVDSGVFSDGLSTTALPVASAAASCPQAIAIGSFQGTSSATTPRGSWTMSVAWRPSCPAARSRGAAARARRTARSPRRRPRHPRATPSSGRPFSAACSSASSSTRSRSRRAASFSRAPRSPGATRAQPAWTDRAARTAASTAASSPAGIAPTTSPVVGSRTSIEALAVAMLITAGYPRAGAPRSAEAQI